MNEHSNPSRGMYIICIMISLIGGLHAQENDWVIDKMERKEQEAKKEFDSLLVHLKNRWEIKLALGKWFFTNGAKSNEEDLFFLPARLNLWQLIGTWHFSERLFVDLSVGFQLKRDVPAAPNILSVLYGEDISVEGSGVVFIPVGLGLRYYLTKGQFRPLLGIGSGAVLIRSQYILAEGNLVNGITRTDFLSNDRSRFGSVIAGFDYRWGGHSNLSVNLSYYTSGDFTEPVGGYSRYESVVINVGFSIIPFSRKKKGD